MHHLLLIVANLLSFIALTAFSLSITLPNASPLTQTSNQNLTTNLPFPNERYLDILIRHPSPSVLPSRTVFIQMEAQRRILHQLPVYGQFRGIEEKHGRMHFKFEPLRRPRTERPEQIIEPLTNQEAELIIRRVEQAYRGDGLAPDTHFGVKYEDVMLGVGGIIPSGG